MARNKNYSELAENESALGIVEPEEKMVEITSDGVNVRSSLDSAGHRLGIVGNGETYRYIATKDGWHKIEYNGKDGWVCGKHSRLVG